MEKHEIVGEELLERIIEAAPIAIIYVDRRLRIKLINPRGCDHFRISEKEADGVLGKPVTDLLAKFGSQSSPITQKLLTFQYDFDLPDVLLGDRHLNIRCRPVLEGALLTLLNINALKEKETQAFNALLEGQEQERKRFAQEIHDGLGPMLSTLKLGLQNLHTKRFYTGNEDSDPDVLHLIELIDMVTVDVRRISHALLPSSLIDFGVESALVNLCEIVQKQRNVKVSCFVSKRNTRLESNTELGIYRIAQELLNNALKYANAKNIAIQLIRHERTVVLMVEDDGMGFDEEAMRKNMEGIGFKNVMSRVESLGGTFSLEAAIGEGVLVTIELPLKLAPVEVQA